MKHIHLNLKRFDIGKKYGGVNPSSDIRLWSKDIIEKTEERLKELKENYDVEFSMYFPEIHLFNSIEARKYDDVVVSIGCQGVYELDSSVGGNFGAFTSQRTANSMKQVGVDSVIIGHLEERIGLKNILTKAESNNISSVNIILNERIKRACEAGLKVLYCIGETSEEKERWKEVLKNQLEIGLSDVDMDKVLIAYEPVWAIGPGKTPPSSDEIKEVVDYIKSIKPQLEVLYGGGLKKDNAKDLSNIKSLDGGLIALTCFSGDIGFYPDQYIEIIENYLCKEN